MLSKQKLESLLGRPLTSTEDANRELYLKIATDRLKQLLGYDVTREGQEVLSFDPRVGYHTLYVYPLTEVNTITVDGEELSGFTKRQWDDLNADWYNAITFRKAMADKVIKVNATWGFGDLPSDLEYLIAQMFGLVSKEQRTDGKVEQKSIEGYSVRYRDTTDFKSFATDNHSIITKYSILVGEIQSGEVRERIY